MTDEDIEAVLGRAFDEVAASVPDDAQPSPEMWGRLRENQEEATIAAARRRWIVPLSAAAGIAVILGVGAAAVISRGEGTQQPAPLRVELAGHSIALPAGFQSTDQTCGVPTPSTSASAGSASPPSWDLFPDGTPPVGSTITPTTAPIQSGVITAIAANGDCINAVLHPVGDPPRGAAPIDGASNAWRLTQPDGALHIYARIGNGLVEVSSATVPEAVLLEIATSITGQ